MAAPPAFRGPAAAPRAAFHAPAPRAAAPHIAARPPAINRSGPRIAAPAIQRAQRSMQANRPPRSVQANRPAAALGNNSRLQRRQERAQRAVENRQLRALRPQQRAARRQEIQNARQQHALNRQQARPGTLAQPNALRSNARTTMRRNGQPRVNTQAARQDRFASAFAANANRRGAGRLHFAARDAWRHHRRAGFVPWYGPVFWPYAYSDVFDYAFWPDGYDDGYWAYAYDDLFDGVFWGANGPPPEYSGDDASAPALAGAGPRVTQASVQALCTQPGSGVTAWPYAAIEKKVGLSAEQQQLLGDVKSAGDKAAAAFKASCPSERAFPLTPPGRLIAMTARLDATLQAIETVRPPLEKFYASLSDEQKERFNQLGPQIATAANKPAETTGSSANAAGACKQPKAGLTNLPMEMIEDAVKPTDAQETEIKSLEDATAKAVAILAAACPDETPLTPPGRLTAMETRLKAMIEAANTVKPALSSFYGSLSDEQKARFDRIGQTLAQNGGQADQ
jgi:hypothetical protein